MGGGAAQAWCEELLAPNVQAEGELEIPEAAVEGAQGEEEATIDGEDGEVRQECEPMRRAPRPYQPTPMEIEEHNETHYPYRSWCIFCQLAKATGEQRGHGLTESKIPIVALDYFFITESGDLCRREGLEKFGYKVNEDGDETITEARRAGKLVKGIFVKCLKFKAVWAHIVPMKGLDEDGYVVDLVTKDISWFGHTRVIVKSDNEPALVKLVEASLVALRVTNEKLTTVTTENSPEYDSQGNGAVGLHSQHASPVQSRAPMPGSQNREEAPHHACSDDLDG